MSKTIIDRTINGNNKSSTNRDKFFKRSKAQIKKSLKGYITDGADIKSISDGKEKNIKVSSKGMDEPQIVFSQKNQRKQVYVGNKHFNAGDAVGKPPQQDGGRDGNGPGDIGEDDFYFTLSYEEFINLFFEDLELPDMIKKSMTSDDNKVSHPAGYTTDGPPSKLDLLRTMRNSIKRNVAIVGSIDHDIEQLQELLLSEPDPDKKQAIQDEIESLLRQKENIPFIRDLDLRYKKTEIVPQPIVKAVMFCCMDVSGSMSKWHKEVSKRFFMLLYLFLTKQYDHVEIVFVKYHHEASEVDEQDFFYSRETGGTIVSKGLELINKIINERYDSNLVNIYVSHASDGDIWMNQDNIHPLMHEIMDKIQYYAYVDIAQPPEIATLFGSPPSDLLETMNGVKDSLSTNNKDKLQIRQIMDISDIYNVFRGLFEKKS